MNKRELAERLAKQSHKSRAKAADDVDSLVYALLKDMRQTAKKTADETETMPPKAPTVESPAPAKKTAGNKK